jgi:hypothetical protein
MAQRYQKPAHCQKPRALQPAKNQQHTDERQPGKERMPPRRRKEMVHDEPAQGQRQNGLKRIGFNIEQTDRRNDQRKLKENNSEP